VDDGRLAVSGDDELQKLKENARNSNTKKSTQAWVNVWRSWAEYRNINPKLEENAAEELDKIPQQSKDLKLQFVIRSKGSVYTAVHSIDRMMKFIVTCTPLASTGKKKLTNHCARKTDEEAPSGNPSFSLLVMQVSGRFKITMKGPNKTSIISNKQQLSFKSNRHHGP